MYERRRSAFDRRAGKDRRRKHSLAPLSYRMADRRLAKERRSEVERRVGWLRINKTRVSFHRTRNRGSRIDFRPGESGNKRNYVLSLW